MSDTALTKEQINVLGKGLKFAPTPKENLTELEADIKSFCRKLRLKEHFYKDDSGNDKPDILVKNKSKWTPPHNKNIKLDNCISSLSISSEELDNLPREKHTNNVSAKQRDAIMELQNNDSIIIKKADKGGAVCVMNRDFYANKIMEMLKDSSTYCQIEEGQLKQAKSKINKLIEHHGSCLHDEEIDYLLNFESKESNFYGLPKIHKSKSIKDAIVEQNSEYISVKNPADLKFRPIIAGPECPTSRLSHLIDLLLKDLPQLTKSYVRDDINFLSKLQRHLSSEDEHSLVTFDVESLYTNIDHDLGKKAITYWLNKHRDRINPRFTNSFIIEAIKIVLENNTFFFNDQYFIQTNGTAMGTKMAPTYANLVLAYLEEQLYEKYQKKTNKTFADFIENQFLRYLDDCFIVWPHTKYNLDEFSHELNSLHPKFKFTKETSLKEISFLDIRAYIENNTIFTDIFYKPTDTHQFLPFDSCHPRHTKTNIPYCEARRLCTIIDDTKLRDIRLEEMKGFFLRRNYPKKLIDDGIRKACAIPQTILRQVKPKLESEILPFVYTHNPKNPNMVPLIRSSLELLKSNPHMNKVLNSSKFVPSKRQPPNLGKLLVRAKFSDSKTTGGSFKCGDKKCSNCQNMNETQHIQITSTGRQFEIRQRLTCKSVNVLYIITCTGCNEQYVGMTTLALARRFTLHRQHIDCPEYRKLGVSQHLADCSNKQIKFTVSPFYKISAEKDVLLAKEQLFIRQFKPSLNNLTLVP